MSRQLDEKVALVTGGSRGIGSSICVELAKRGAFVWVNYSSSPQKAEETVAACKEVGGDAKTIQFNVAHSGEVDTALAAIKEESGKLDILVNNAGISKDGLVLRMKDEDFEATLKVNLFGSFYCARAAAKLMAKARSGRIINMSSVTAEMGNAGQVPYISSKSGIIGLTKALAKELAGRSVTVNAITPGFIETEMTADLSEKNQEEYLKNVPLGRFGKSEEVAHLVGFLASEHSAYITGQVIGINGGMYM